MNRVLFVNVAGEMGGAEISLLLLVRHLSGRFVPIVACPGPGRLWQELTANGIEPQRLCKPPKRRYISPGGFLYWLRASWTVLRILFRTRADIVHANSLHAGAVAVAGVVLMRKKLVVHARNLPNYAFGWRFVSRFCTEIVAVSEAVRSWLVEHNVDTAKITVVYNGLDNSVLHRDSGCPNRFYLPGPRRNNSFVFAHVGQFVPWKNQTGFIEAASRLARELPEARFLLVGDDIFGRDSRYKNDLLDRIKNSPIADKVSFLGWQKQMDCVWAKIDCLVHTAEREPFGRVVIEAMAHKVPVIAADRCGPAEIIRNGRTGILFEPGDVEQLTEAMLKIARDRTFAAAIAQGAERQVLSNFTADKTAAGIEQIYARVLAAD